MQHYSREILERGFLTNDRFVSKFEHAYACWNQSKYSVAVCNGTAAIEMALLAIGVAGKRVIIPSNTFIATAIAVINAGGNPIIIDIERNYMGTCPRELSKAIEKYSDIGAVCHVHVGSHISTDFQQIIKICCEHQIPLVEDACQGIGAKLNGISAGNFGRFGCYSFFTTKNMTTGEGGIVTCHEDSDYRQLKSIRQFGKSHEDSTLHVGPGSNYKMNEFSAALGVIELQRIDLRIARRREIANRYQDNLKGSHFCLIKDRDHSNGSYYKQIIVSETIPRSKIQKHLLAKKIHCTGGVYYLPLHRQPRLRQWVNEKTYSNSDWFADHHFCPPCYPELTDVQVDQICEELLSIERSF